MSPAEAVREKAISVMADPIKGLNPAFVAGCLARQIEVPIAGDGGNAEAPFDFGPNSASLFRMLENIEWLAENSAQQYPCILIGGKNARQFRQGRVLGSRFHGNVEVRMQMYVAWYTQQTPPDDDFEKTLDALEDATLSVLNANPTGWNPVVYSNLVDIDRLPMTAASNNQIVRRGLDVAINATVIS